MPEDVEFYPNARPVPLNNGRFAIVDAEDYDRVMAAGPWRVLMCGQSLDYPYAVRAGRERMHRFILGLRVGERPFVDHINGNTLDNRKSNLRVATPKENAANRGTVRTRRGRKVTSRFKGVYWSTTAQKWRVDVQAKRPDGRPGSVQLYRADFADEEEAARAYDDAVRRFRPGPFERFNFPRPGERGLDGKLVPLPIPAQRSEEPSLCSPSACGSCPLNGLCGDPADLPPELPDVDPREPRPEGSLLWRCVRILTASE